MPSPPATRLLTPRLWFGVAVVALYLGLALSPPARRVLGIHDLGKWFLDSYAVLAASDGAQLGLDPAAPNPLDAFHRPHSYSDWWLLLGRLGLTRADNFLLGGAWVAGFLASLLLMLRPRSLGAAAWFTLLAVSPPIYLGIVRANNDLVIFALLTLAAATFRWRGTAAPYLALALIAVATGLKFYPVAAGVALLLVSGVRARRRALVVAAVVLGGVLLSVAPQVPRGSFRLEPEAHTMGARIGLMDLGLPAGVATASGVGLLALLAAIASRRGWTTGLAEETSGQGERAAMTVAAAVLTFCFLATINFGYRWCFALGLAPWLWTRRHAAPAARVLLVLLPLVLWKDGLLVLATEWWFPHLAPAAYDRIHWRWRLATEPLVWALFGLLGGWLWDLVRTRWREAQRPAIPDALGGS